MKVKNLTFHLDLDDGHEIWPRFSFDFDDEQKVAVVIDRVLRIVLFQHGSDSGSWKEAGFVKIVTMVQIF
jgi:hypothetical protein